MGLDDRRAGDRGAQYLPARCRSRHPSFTSASPDAHMPELVATAHTPLWGCWFTGAVAAPTRRRLIARRGSRRAQKCPPSLCLHGSLAVLSEPNPTHENKHFTAVALGPFSRVAETHSCGQHGGLGPRVSAPRTAWSCARSAVRVFLIPSRSLSVVSHLVYNNYNEECLVVTCFPPSPPPPGLSLNS